MTSRLQNGTLSELGIKFLSEPIMREALSKVAEAVNVTPEEYLLRFEEILTKEPERIFDIFEKRIKASN